MRSGALDFSDLLADIQRPVVECPDLSASSPKKSLPDLFAEKKRAAWKDVQVAEARCDFAPNRMRLTNRGGVFFISLWKTSVYGRTLSDIKSDPEMVDFFAENIAQLIRSVIGSFLSPLHFAIVTTPKRRHTQKNFASMIAEKIGKLLGLPFFEDCALAPSRHRVGAIFSANNIPEQNNIIVFDDFVTTGQTLVSMQNLLMALSKSCSFFVGINNKL